MSAAIVLDLVVAGLLVVTIGYAVTLNRRLGQLRRSSAAMAGLIEDFNRAAKSAEAGITALKSVTEQDDGALMRQLESLGALRDELDGLVARAEAQTTRLGGERKAAPHQTAPRRAAPKSPDAALDAALFGEPQQSSRAAAAAPKRPRALAG